MDLRHKKVVIVGAGSDIAQRLMPMLRQAGANVRGFTSSELDVTDLSKIGRISRENPHILIVFAGVIRPAPILSESISDWHWQINVNLIGSYNAAHAAFYSNPKCKVILIGSSAARKPRPNWSAYCASKAGLNMFARCAIDEGLDVWCLNIGRTETKMRRHLFGIENPSELLSTIDVCDSIVNILKGQASERISWISKPAPTSSSSG